MTNPGIITGDRSSPPPAMNPKTARIAKTIYAIVHGQETGPAFEAMMSVLLTLSVNVLAEHDPQWLRAMMKMCGERLIQFSDVPAEQIREVALAMGDNQTRM